MTTQDHPWLSIERMDYLAQVNDVKAADAIANSRDPLKSDASRRRWARNAEEHEALAHGYRRRANRARETQGLPDRPLELGERVAELLLLCERTSSGAITTETVWRILAPTPDQEL